ncbi:MAG: hypothetical protein H0W52_12835, partial [Rubrobacteraceae bacterium]|nr:hypothetical protein [Rubrobacteraceae bacterium]
MAGLKVYSAVLGRTISDSRSAYEATHENAVKQLEMRRNTILNTKASTNFNQQLDKSAIALTKVEAEIGRRLFPSLTKLLNLWTSKIPQLTPPLFRLMEGVTRVGVAFGTAYAHGQKFANLQKILGFVADSGIKAATALSNIADAGIQGLQAVIPAASRLQDHIVRLTGATREWVNSAEGMKTLRGIVDTLEQRFYQLVHIVRDFSVGIIGVFQALNKQGGVDRLMSGLEGLAKGFRKVMSESGSGREAIIRFMDAAQPTLNQLWRLTKTVVREFGLLASNVVKAGQSGDKMGTLARVIKAVRDSISPLRKLFQDTFIALGPVLAELIPEATEFLGVFLGSSGPLKVFLGAATKLLRVFNRLPDGVKSAVAAFLAFKAIVGGLGLGALIVGTGKLATNFWAMRRASKASAAALLATSGAGTKAATGTAAAGVATGAAATRFARLRAAAKAVGVSLLAFAGIASGGLVIALAAAVAAGILIWKNWDKIKKATKPLTAAFGDMWRAVKPVAKELGGALLKAITGIASGFLSVV